MQRPVPAAQVEGLAVRTQRRGADPGEGGITDYAQIAALGVMATPALAIDDQVVLAGRIPALQSLKATLAEQLPTA